MTLAATAAEAARRFPDAVAIEAAGGWTLSFGLLDRLADEVAVALAEDHGVTEGDLVTLLLPSTPEYVVAYVALARLGAVTAGVNPRYTAPERSAVLAVAQPALVVATADLQADVTTTAPILTVDIADDPDSILAALRAGTAGRALRPLPDPADPERLVAVVFTSGTTGTPKGAMFGQRELAAITRADLGDRADQWGGGAPMIAATQFAHVGFMTKLPWYLQLGCRTILLDRWRAADVLRLIEEHRIPSVGGIAPHVALMLRDPTFDQRDLSCVQTIVMGGAFSPPELVREARRRFGAAYSIRYSSTESGGVGTATAFDADDDEALFTVGRPRGGVEIEIRDDDDRPVPAGDVGELCLRSPTMMRGYWRDPEATAATIRHGWLHSGDLARIDDRGLVRLAGRKKEMFIRGGYNIYPVEIEAVLRDHPAVLDVAVVPRPDAVMGEIGVAVVVPRPGHAAPTLEDLRSFAADRLAHHKLPEAVRVIDALPETAMQKVDRATLTHHEASAAAAADGNR